MAGSKSDYLENAILDHVLGSTSYTKPGTVYVALYTTAPSDGGGGTEVSTGVWTNYSRSSVTNNSTNWPAASSGVKANGTEISFGTATISGAAPTVVAMGIFDAASAGNLLFWATLGTNKTVNNGDVVKFNVSGISIVED